MKKMNKESLFMTYSKEYCKRFRESNVLKVNSRFFVRELVFIPQINLTEDASSRTII